MLAIIPVAKSAAPRSMPRKEEMKKVLDVLAMDAATYVLFDNIKGMIGGEEIGGAVAGGVVGWFGYTEMREVGVAPKRTLEVLKQDQVWIENEARTA